MFDLIVPSVPPAVNIKTPPAPIFCQLTKAVARFFLFWYNEIHPTQALSGAERNPVIS